MKALKALFFFSIAGGIGFLVDVAVLYLSKPVVGVYFGRLISFSMAVIVTWIFNRNVTFKDNSANMSMLAEFINYLSLMIIGGLINLGIYYSLITSFGWLQQMPIIAVAVGSIAGMAANFVSSRYFLYKNR